MGLEPNSYNQVGKEEISILRAGVGAVREPPLRTLAGIDFGVESLG